MREMKRITFNTILNVLLVGMVALFIGRYFYTKPRHINGEAAPDFTAQTLDGRQVSLSNLKGKYVLIDFWGSWCGPCRAENPRLVSLYRKYRDTRFKDADGFEIVSIAVEKDPERWQRAIRADNLLWPYHILDQASSLKFFDSPLASLYGVKALPTKYLLNGDGVIIGVNLSAEEIEKALGRKKV
jgi:thiol-disulfide isomerase/thioredoxin